MAPSYTVDPELCLHYAGFMSRLDRRRFDALYWTLFFVVLLSLFASSWIYQRTMMFRDKPNTDDAAFRKRLKLALGLSTAIFLVTAVICIIEVYALLALQFCDGEDLMSLFWATWTMLQLGSEIAILGVALALWHSIYEIRHPKWALALGTPVLVVAGFGHVIQYAIESCWKRNKQRRNERRNNRRPSSSGSITAAPSTIELEKEDTISSSKPGQEQIEDRLDSASMLEAQTETETEADAYYFALDVGGDERVRAWPSFAGMTHDGKAILQLTRTPRGRRGVEPPADAISPGPSRS